MPTLTTSHCVPCSVDIPPLTVDESRTYLVDTPAWELHTDTPAHFISRELVCKDFLDALTTMQKIGTVAEQEGHHPDLHLTNYNHLEIHISTHHIGGLSQNDFILAAKLDAIL
jgi:4a-hydroxytetrahydrobiopterin dehydratase